MPDTPLTRARQELEAALRGCAAGGQWCSEALPLLLARSDAQVADQAAALRALAGWVRERVGPQGLALGPGARVQEEAGGVQRAWPDAAGRARASLGVCAAGLEPEGRAPGELLRLGAALVGVLCADQAARWEALGQGTLRREGWLFSLSLLPGALRARVAEAHGLRASWGGAPPEGAVADSRALPPELAAAVERAVRGRPLDGVLVRGDALRALNALETGGVELGGLEPAPWGAQGVDVVITDPPYNTGRSLFRYADRREPDLWRALVGERLAQAWRLLGPRGALAAFIDPAGLGPLREALDGALEGALARGPLATVAWQKVYTRKNSARGLSGSWDAVLLYTRGELPPLRLPWTAALSAAYRNPDGDPRGPWISNALQARNPYSAGRYALRTPGGREVAGPPEGTWWRLSEERLWALHAEGRVWWGREGRALPRIKRYLQEREGGLVCADWWPHTEVGSNAEARAEARALLGQAAQGLTPKPTRVLMRLVGLLAPQPGAWVLDPFAGSGSLGWAALRMRREQGQGPKVLLVEAGESFERALVPGLLRAAAGGAWCRGGGGPVEVLYAVGSVRAPGSE